MEYVFALGDNARLEQRVQRIEAYAKADYLAARAAVHERLLRTMRPEEITAEHLDALVLLTVRYGCFPYQTLDSWSSQR